MLKNKTPAKRYKDEDLNAPPSPKIEDFIPQENYVLVRIMRAKEMGSLALPDSAGGAAEDQLGMALVMAVGPGAVDPKGVMHIPKLTPGDIVFIPFALMQQPFLWPGTTRMLCMICRDTQLCGRLREHGADPADDYSTER